MARIFRGYTFRAHESSDSPSGVLPLPGNQVESSARALWFAAQLSVQWKATESEGCQFKPDGRDLANGEKLDSGSAAAGRAPAGASWGGAPTSLPSQGGSCRLIAHSSRERIAEFSMILID
jgi:hypothetical protein